MMIYQTLISCRPTKQGDWLVFEAVPAVNGIGIEKTDTPTGGYTTGRQYARFGDEDEAVNYAKNLVERYGWEYVEWKNVGKNAQFVDLPKRYPTQTSYDSWEAAEADGWIYIPPHKRLEYYHSHRIYVADVTPGRRFGYNLVVQVIGNNQPLAESTEVWADGQFSPRFRTGDVVDAIYEARRWIDQNGSPAQTHPLPLAPEDSEALRVAVDHAVHTWANYVRHEVAPDRREAMAKPAPENVLFRLMSKHIVPATTSVEEVVDALEKVSLTITLAAWMYDVPAPTIKATVKKGAIEGAKQEGGRGKWYFSNRAFKAWLADPEAHKTGPKSSRDSV